VGPSQYLSRQKLDQHNCDQKERKISIVTPHGATNDSKHVAATIAVMTRQLTAKLVRCPPRCAQERCQRRLNNDLLWMYIADLLLTHPLFKADPLSLSVADVPANASSMISTSGWR
jgi:hypothetical protein